jgi:GT2 family glycosyltransferase
MKTNVAIIIPNWNGKELLSRCLESVNQQTRKPDMIIVVDNGSVDGSVDYLQKHHQEVIVIKHNTNIGFAGGVNSGLRLLLDKNYDWVGLLNNDAVLDKNWLKRALETVNTEKGLGAVAGKILSADKKTVDSTGDFYTTWGLPFNRDRDLPASQATSTPGFVFGPCAGAALYNVAMFKDVGLFDEDFFAYHEDADLHFRMQLRGWKSYYNPEAVAYHATSSTSKKLPGFTTYHTFKNFPQLFWKNVPLGLIIKILPRFVIAYSMIYFNSLFTGKGWPATKGVLMSLFLLPKKLVQRRSIQKNRKLSSNDILKILVQDLPPSAIRLRKLRSFFTSS